VELNMLMKNKIGSLFTGYGGLDMAIEELTGGTLAWYSEIEPAACKILESIYPDVPNLGDIKKIDWNEVEAVDIITGGYPCQPFSTAGKREGENDDRHLWPFVRDAIDVLRPKRAILENVRGHLSLGFKEVLMDIADLGYDAEWGTFRASDVGAPHRRERLFIIAYPDSQGIQGHEDSGSETPSTRQGHFEQGVSTPVIDWGKYAPAIRRWESVLNRPTPTPTVGPLEKRRLNPQFVEWMMGLPDGWVTGHELSTAKELKMLGNGVCPQQAREAVKQLITRIDRNVSQQLLKEQSK